MLNNAIKTLMPYVGIRTFFSSKSTHLEATKNNKQIALQPTLYRFIPTSYPPIAGGRLEYIITQQSYEEFKKWEEKEESKFVAASMVIKPIDMEHLELPSISKLNEVHTIGSLCNFVVGFDQSMQPPIYKIGLFPKIRCKIIKMDDGPGYKVVKVEQIIQKVLKKSDIDMEQGVLYDFISASFSKLAQEFKLNIDATAMQHKDNLRYLLYDIANVLLMFSIYYPLPFKKKDVPQVAQSLYIEEDFTQQLRIVNNTLNDFVHTLAMWKELERKQQSSQDAASEQEKLKTIYHSLKEKFTSDSNGKAAQIKKFKTNLEGKKVPQLVQQVIDEELDRYASMDNNAEGSVTRTYLDYLTTMPWGISTTDTVDLDNAKEILDNDHYGMDDVKERILEFLAVSKLRHNINGKILLLVGPPGVGKTSIGESIARAIGRKFKRISMGGATDSNTLKGFRRTYTGAIPGKIVQALRTIQVENPVILIDEVDKVGQRSAQGDPTGVLLEVLDPEQNTNFTDDFLDVPIDLSKILFICTANTTESIHPALLDRMEVITISGYTAKEKLHILDKYLLPKSILNSGLTTYTSLFSINQKAKEQLIENYCREPGVRSLFTYVKRITEKIALKVSQHKPENIIVTSQTLIDYIGQPRFSSSRIYDITPTGVVCGLAYSEYGGSILFIEATESNFSAKSTGQLKITGHLGEVMKESSSIAHTYAKNFINKYLPNNKELCGYLDNKEVHLHFPEGAITKDGPSAGIAITSTLISLAMKQPIIQGIAMTGEISLLGKVLPIGGVKEKLMAAQREGIKLVILPKQNEINYNKLGDEIKSEVKALFVNEYIDVFRIVFPSVRLNGS